MTAAVRVVAVPVSSASVFASFRTRSLTFSTAVRKSVCRGHPSPSLSISSESVWRASALATSPARRPPTPSQTARRTPRSPTVRFSAWIGSTGFAAVRSTAARSSSLFGLFLPRSVFPLTDIFIVVPPDSASQRCRGTGRKNLMKSIRFLAIAGGVLLDVGLGFAQTGAAIAERERGSARAVEFRRLIPSLPGTGAISGIAFEDANGNGLLDSGEHPFAGLMVLLNLDVPAPVFAPTLAVTFSRADGTFEFHDIPFGKYVVIVPDPSGYGSTSPGNPPSVRVVLDDAHPNISGLLFGKALAGGVISGTSFRDLDGSGSRDAGEPGVPGIRIELRLVTGQLIASTQTDSSGNFLFGRGLAGTYELTQVLPGGLAQTLPRGDGTTRVTLTSGP